MTSKGWEDKETIRKWCRGMLPGTMGSRVGNATGLAQLSHFLYSELHPRAAATHWNATHTPAGEKQLLQAQGLFCLSCFGVWRNTFRQHSPPPRSCHLLHSGLWWRALTQHDGHLLCNCQLAPSNLAQATCRRQLCQPGMDLEMFLPPWGSSPSSPLLEVVEASMDRFFKLWWSNCSRY